MGWAEAEPGLSPQPILHYKFQLFHRKDSAATPPRAQYSHPAEQVLPLSEAFVESSQGYGTW